ncbi:holin [Streptomyces sp. NPDC020412]|uniref:holin n=1 Tax=Streptomyces sp. NPDC020412 TaxID=3365073 RepID=UPI0037B9ED74
MFTAAFWRATGERAIRTAAQATIGAISADQLGLLDVDWGQAASVGGLAAVLAVLTAIATSGGTEGPGVTEQVRATWPRGDRG